MANNGGVRPPVRQIQSSNWQAYNPNARLPKVQGGQAIHYTGPKPPATPAGTPPWANGTAAAGGPAGAPPAAPPQAAAPPPYHPDLSGSKWMGYLSPDQLQQLNAAGSTYGVNIGQEERHSGLQVDGQGNVIRDASGNPALTQGDAEIQYNQAVADAQRAHDVQQAQANEELAARGLFQSSIRANDLADIDTAMVSRQVSARAALNSLVADAADAIGRLNAGWAGTQGQYMGFAATNAINSAPTSPAPPPSAPPQQQAPPPQQPPRPQPSIMQQVQAAHPTWFPPKTPAPAAKTPPKPNMGKANQGSFSSSAPKRVR